MTDIKDSFVFRLAELVDGFAVELEDELNEKLTSLEIQLEDYVHDFNKPPSVKVKIVDVVTELKTTIKPK